MVKYSSRWKTCRLHTKQITRKIQAYIEKKKKVKVKEVTIKEQLMLFLNCVIENPSFDSQSKESRILQLVSLVQSVK